MPSAHLGGANSLTPPVKGAAGGFRNVGHLATAIFPGLGACRSTPSPALRPSP